MLDKKYELLKAFPIELKNDVLVALNWVNQTNKLDFSHCYEVEFCGSLLIIPERIYNNVPSSLQFNYLTDIQQVILSCLFTRHHNGFIREEYLRKIVNRSKEYNWIIPYLIRLTGEYVLDILIVIKDNEDQFDKEVIKRFLADNPRFYNTIESQIVSYWNCYYRNKYPNIEEYVGFEIINYFRLLFK